MARTMTKPARILIVFGTRPEAIKLLLSVAVIELERQLRTAQFGDIPESLENSREYKAAK